MKKQLVRYGFWAASIGIMVVIFCFSAQNGEQSGGTSMGFTSFLVRLFSFEPLSDAQVAGRVAALHPFIRKAAHFSIYLLLGTTLSAALATYPLRAPVRGALALAICFLYASFDELHQALVPARGPGFGDVLLDSCGALVGVLLFLGAAALVRRRRASRTG